MANTYGYKPQKLGYGYQQPSRNTSPLALAAGKRAAVGPFFTDTTSSAQTQARSPFTQPTPKTTTPHTDGGPSGNGVGGTDVGIPPGYNSAATAPAAPGVAAYDINTDPALQQAQSLLGMNDAQAQAQALKLKQQEILAYGDPTVAAALFGQDDPFVAASKQNPTSTLAQLGQQHDRGLTDLTEGLNKQNLAYSGARVKGEQQFGQDYQSALAEAASGLNQRIGGIDSTLAQALAQNNYGRVGALQDAYGRHQNDPGVDPGAAAAAGAGGGFVPPTPDTNQSPDQRNRPGITADSSRSGLTTEAILAALLGPGASQARLNRYAG